MDLIKNFELLFKEEPEKTFIKIGFLRTDGSFEEEGRRIFMRWLLKKYGNEFKEEVANKILAEMEKNGDKKK